MTTIARNLIGACLLLLLGVSAESICTAGSSTSAKPNIIFLYEEGSKAPLIIYDPRLPKAYAGNVRAAVTANVDMAPTIFALAGVPAPADIDGKNLLPLVTNPKGQVREFLPLFNTQDDARVLRHAARPCRQACRPRPRIREVPRAF